MLVSSFDDAVRLLQERRLKRYDTSAGGDGSALGAAYVIGGAALYRYVLQQQRSAHWSLDGLLVTRIYAPNESALPCDVFLQEFRSAAQSEWEARVAQECQCDQLPEGERVCPHTTDESAPWQQVSTEEHRKYLSDIPQAADAGTLARDNGMVYAFQLWRRSGAHA